MASAFILSTQLRPGGGAQHFDCNEFYKPLQKIQTNYLNKNRVRSNRILVLKTLSLAQSETAVCYLSRACYKCPSWNVGA